MSAIAAIAGNTFRESIRNRILHALVGATLALSGLSYVLAWISGDEAARRARVITDVSLSGIALLGALSAIFLGTNLIYNEIERRTVYTILARPVSRAEFILGKFAGLAAVVTVAVLVMGAGFAGFAALFAAIDGRPVGLGAGHVLAIAFVAVELIVVVAIAILFSSIAHPIEGAVFAFVVAMAGRFAGSLDRLATDLVTPKGGVAPSGFDVALAKAIHVLYVLFPDFEKLNFQSAAATPVPLDLARARLALAYAAVYCALALALAILGFRRKTL